MLQVTILQFKVKCIFINHKVSYTSKLTRPFFEDKIFTWEKIEWSYSSPDQNPIENFWSVVEMKLLEGE